MFSAGPWPLKKARYRARFCMDLKTAPSRHPGFFVLYGLFFSAPADFGSAAFRFYLIDYNGDDMNAFSNPPRMRRSPEFD
jgi:hypothetical protein